MLVTGGAGFIGSNLVDALIANDHDVVVVDDLSRGRKDYVHSAAKLVVCDVTSGDLPAAIAEASPDMVFHLAAQIDVRRSVREPLVDTNINVVGSVNVLQACHDANVRRVIFASSGGAIYGDTDVLPTPETHPAKPASQYGAAKLCAEIYGDIYSQLGALDFVALRFANVYGPRQDPHGEAGVVAIFAQKLLRGEVATVNGDGTQTRDYVHVADVVSANLAAIAAEPGAYNVGTGVETDVNGIYASVARACQTDAEPHHAAAKSGEQLRSCLDPTKAKDALGWTAKWSLDQGIASTVDYFR